MIPDFLEFAIKHQGEFTPYSHAVKTIKSPAELRRIAKECGYSKPKAAPGYKARIARLKKEGHDGIMQNGMSVCSACGRTAKLASRGLCWECHGKKTMKAAQKKRKETLAKKRAGRPRRCLRCEEIKPVVSWGLCRTCTSWARYHGKLEEYRRLNETGKRVDGEAPRKTGKKPKVVCAKCENEKPIVARGLCRNCYNRENENGTIDNWSTSLTVRVARNDNRKLTS